MTDAAAAALAATETHAIRVRFSVRGAAAADCTSNSATRLLAPITLDGCTALSVEIIRKRSQPECCATSARMRVPLTLLTTASEQLFSITGTCLYAAACSTTCGR